MRYELVMDWNSDADAYVARVPELPGCVADGETYQEALQEVLIAMEVWIEAACAVGNDIPAPSPVHL